MRNVEKCDPVQIILADFGRCKPVNACQPYSPHYNMQISRLYCSRSNMQCTALVTLPMETGVAVGVYNVLDIFTDNDEYEILSATPQHRAELYCLFVIPVCQERTSQESQTLLSLKSPSTLLEILNKAHLRISTETYEKVVELISEHLAAEYNGLTPCLTRRHV